jgi:hypothetical protein
LFVKRIEFNPPRIAVDYTILLPLEDGLIVKGKIQRRGPKALSIIANDLAPLFPKESVTV